MKVLISINFFFFLFRLLSTFIRTERCWLWYWFWNTINRNVKFIFFSQSGGGRNELQVKQRFIFYSCCFSFVINVFLERLFFALYVYLVCVCVCILLERKTYDWTSDRNFKKKEYFMTNHRSILIEHLEQQLENKISENQTNHRLYFQLYRFVRWVDMILKNTIEFSNIFNYINISFE